MPTAVIMQPTYLPWIGYFDLMDRSDFFVFLDSVQFEKRSWQQRNKIKTETGELLLTVPVLSKGKFTQKICEMKIDITAGFGKKHIRSIECSYAKADFYERYMKALEKILCKNHICLADLNIELITWLKEILGIKTELIRSSSLGIEGQKVQLLVNICKALGIQRYISPAGSRVYIEENDIFADNGIELNYHNFKHPQYKQLYGDFIPYLSIIDLLFNEGDKSLSIIRSGRS